MILFRFRKLCQGFKQFLNNCHSNFGMTPPIRPTETEVEWSSCYYNGSRRQCEAPVPEQLINSYSLGTRAWNDEDGEEVQQNNGLEPLMVWCYWRPLQHGATDNDIGLLKIWEKNQRKKKKLDEVGPVDNRPSTDLVFQFKNKYIKTN